MIETSHLGQPLGPTEWIISKVRAIRIESDCSIGDINATRQGRTQVCEESIRLIPICDDDGLEVVCL